MDFGTGEEMNRSGQLRENTQPVSGRPLTGKLIDRYDQVQFRMDCCVEFTEGFWFRPPIAVLGPQRKVDIVV
jgi:hypothetical protein